MWSIVIGFGITLFYDLAQDASSTGWIILLVELRSLVEIT